MEDQEPSQHEPRPGRTTSRIFADKADIFHEQPVLPWGTTLRMSWANIRNRAGRFVLIFIGIGVVVAFLSCAFTSHAVLGGLARSDDVHVRAVLEKTGVFADDAAATRQESDRQKWLLVLSCVLCVVVIANTMLMSVTERFSEIGTLKCLGALDRFIVRMFLVESIFLGLVSSLAGALAGYLLTLLQIGCSLGFAALWAAPLLKPLAAVVALGVAAGTAITVAAAAYPAYVAAKMRPVDAMRAEV
ncbi:MAG: FtsX-like permease family protein [Planctomycetota bacterium]